MSDKCRKFFLVLYNGQALLKFVTFCHEKLENWPEFCNFLKYSWHIAHWQTFPSFIISFTYPSFLFPPEHWATSGQLSQVILHESDSAEKPQPVSEREWATSGGRGGCGAGGHRARTGLGPCAHSVWLCRVHQQLHVQRQELQPGPAGAQQERGLGV